jgi:NAD(P)-dependent dehydrogenase (short-subunit alcohol dehydrogenase family)
MAQATLLDYSATKGCILAFTRSLAQQLQDKGEAVGLMGQLQG